MIRISHVTIFPGEDLSDWTGRAAGLLGVPEGELSSARLVRQSIDARKKGTVRYVCTLEVTARDEAGLVRRAKSPHITLEERREYRFPPVSRRSGPPPVIVGSGPAGLFAALFLARAGIPSILMERGRPVEERAQDVARFWRTGALDPASNVQFGEGGAGTFSDGKLTTGIHDPRVTAVLETLAAAGAPADILYQQKPHIGTDILRQVVRSLRQELVNLGCEVRFGHKLTGLTLREGRVAGVSVQADGTAYALSCDTLVLAPGHSARDTFSMLLEAGVPMASKPFAIGVRIEHPQSEVSKAQFGPQWRQLPPADYKLACHLPSGRSAFTFCVCPGGQVVAAASEEGRLVTNGMSLRARDGGLINGGFLVGVSPEDFESAHPLAGAHFQARWERAAFHLGGGDFRAPAQTVGDYLKGRASRTLDAARYTYAPGVTPADLAGCLPGFVAQSLAEALPLLDKRLRGFAHPEAVMTGVETRSSSPVRILRGEDCQSPLGGLYPCGEGAGYAGGITSAAVDGIRVAEAVARGEGAP